MRTMELPSQAGAVDGLPKVEAQTAAEVLELYEPSAEAAALAQADTTPARYVDLLFEAELFDDAISFLCYALPKREVVWWGLTCAHEATGEKAAPELTQALEATQQWLDDPTDDLRRAARVAAEVATYGTPAGCMALAAFFSEGSLSPADCPPVPVGEGFCARTAAAGILLSSLQAPPDEIAAQAKAFATRGIDVARCKAPWEQE